MAARKFLVPIDMTKLEIQNQAVHNLASAPASPATGQLYWNSTDKILYYWNGTAWTQAGGGTGVTYGSVTAEPTFGSASADGVATSVTRSDHKHGNPTHVGADHSAISLSALAVPTGNIGLGGFKITSLADPTNATEAATKQYVDNLVSGLAWTEPARATTTANISLTAAQTIDGVSIIANDRVLVKNQTTASQNGLYLCQAGAWTRTTDADLGTEVESLAVFVAEGTTQADTAWVCTTDAPITVGTTSLTFVQFAGPGAVVAGTGLTSTGNTMNVIGGVGMVANADDIAVLRTDTNGRVPLRYAVDIGGSTAVTVTHNLNTLDVIATVFDKSTGAEIDTDVVHATVNTLTVNFAVAPGAAAYRCVVIG